MVIKWKPDKLNEPYHYFLNSWDQISFLFPPKSFTELSIRTEEDTKNYTVKLPSNYPSQKSVSAISALTMFDYSSLARHKKWGRSRSFKLLIALWHETCRVLLNGEIGFAWRSKLNRQFILSVAEATCHETPPAYCLSASTECESNETSFLLFSIKFLHS